ncbi:MAG: hypothetical protein AAFX02_00520, partial [Pseudomonadota bacterium]
MIACSAAALQRDELQDICADTSGVQMLNEIICTGVGVVMLPRSPGSIVTGIRTRIDLTKGSRRVYLGARNGGELHGGHDLAHMNSEFGRMWRT